jgi:tRNA A37 methylthiotransferase MiaB
MEAEAVSRGKVHVWQNGLCITYLLRLRQMETFLQRNGFSTDVSLEEADMVLIGACAAFLPYFDLFKRRVDAAAALNKRIVVYGCLPIVDARFYRATVPQGTVFIPAISPQRIERDLDGLKVRFDSIPPAIDFRREDYATFDPGKKYIAIQEGCTQACVYCPHKLSIGRPRSLSMAAVLEQVGRACREGAHTIVLEGNDGGSWGLDLSPPQTYEHLLTGILAAGSGFNIHVGNFAPKWFRRYPGVFRNSRIMDIKSPIQTASPDLLRRMGRDGFIVELGPIMDRLKAVNPALVRRTEIIIGLPTETDEDFERTLAFTSAHFDRVACFTYDYHPSTVVASRKMPLLDDATIASRVLRAMAHFGRHPECVAAFDNRGRVCAKITQMPSGADTEEQAHRINEVLRLSDDFGVAKGYLSPGEYYWAGERPGDPSQPVA